MTLKTVLEDAFVLLRQHPRIFLPRLVMTLVWSAFWIVIIRLVQNPLAITFRELAAITLLFLIMLPFQIWVYNAYFILVKQHKEGDFRLVDSFKQGLRKLPEGIAAFALILAAAIAVSLPGIVSFAFGTVRHIPFLQALGVLLMVSGVLAVLVLSFFTPAAVVIGEQTFMDNLERGVMAAHNERREVIIITVLSFVILVLTQFVHSSLATLGVIGFIVGRLVAAVVSVYFLLVNPELFLQTTQSANG
jgi:hypothetical protein